MNITLILLACSLINGACVIETPHQDPWFDPLFETMSECKKEGTRLKKTRTKQYAFEKVPVDVKFRCVPW
ncbi:MAG: hypothetical protein COA96_10170 [SAR86 cluster bacterium]|uniref:Uncharacterized protein n=1 Tax=SAR86 cluster bacterium TaxID=2030880 RepID=A0A2A5AYC6_9GAMM|nr:MAG: hypothetical protein COA96_10170 [SAR86 cluster bacterium]